MGCLFLYLARFVFICIDQNDVNTYKYSQPSQLELLLTDADVMRCEECLCMIIDFVYVNGQCVV